MFGPRCRYSRGLVSQVSLSQSLERTDKSLVVAPACHGILVDLLSHLPGASGDDLAFALIKFQAPCIPFERNELEHLAGPGLLIGYQVLIAHLQNESGRQDRAPM